MVSVSEEMHVEVYTYILIHLLSKEKQSLTWVWFNFTTQYNLKESSII